MTDPENRTRALWTAVIVQALEDAMPGSLSTVASRQRLQEVDKAEAREWLTGMSDDFRQACSLADVDPEWIQKQALEQFEAYDARPNVSKRKAEHLVSHQGRTQSISAWSRELGISRATLSRRLRVNGTIEGAERSKPLETLTFNGETLTFKQWAKRLGVTVATIRHRIGTGWGLKRALTQPNTSSDERLGIIDRSAAPQPKRKAGRKPINMHTHAGETLSITEWAKRKGMPMRTLRNRLALGWTFERAITDAVAARGANLVAPATQPDLGHRGGGGSQPLPFGQGPAGDRNNRSSEIEVLEIQDLAA